ncbi:unnamed protein product, partial [Sphacelaria rigidula]
VQCLAIDGEGRLLVTGDENGVICARLLHQADGRVANGHHASCPRDREGASLGSDGDGTTVASAAAHEGGVFAVSHVRRDTRVGVKGGRGDVVRLWMATYEDVQHGTGSAARLSLNILTEMHVGGCQVSSLATGPSYRTPLVMVGCAEGTVFGFALEPPPPDGSLACGTKNKIQLGRLLMKLQHTRQRVTSVTCSREEELIATADAEGIVRTYRPLVTGDKAGDAAFVGADGLPSRQFELVVECRLGSAAALCEFAIEQVETIAPRDGGRDGDSTEGVAAAAVKQARREEQEVLRTCTKHGARVRVWPAAALPKTPLRPLPLQLPSSPPPPPLHPNRHQDTRIPIPPGYTADDTNPPPRNFENEEKQQGSSETRPSVAHGGSEEHVDDKEEARGRGEEREEGPNPSATAPIPGQRPATPRRVSFANAEQVYKYSTPNREDDTESFSMDNWGQDTGQHDNNQREDEEDDEQDPRPPPPAPTPRPSGPSHPRKLKQHWGSSALGRGNHVPMDAARESKEDVFVRPSSLQEPSLWSTAMEQQALELKMKEEFDSFATRQHLEQQTFRGAAASAVNVHPLARTFEGLVPVSLDAPPPRPKRKGKQVSKAHLSKVEQERITEEQLLFDGMEPDRSSIASNMGSSHMVQLQDMEWYGARPAYNQQEDNCFVADRVWSWGVRP